MTNRLIKMAEERDAIMATYLAAFRGANKGRELPTIRYDSGWFFIGDTRYRKDSILRMTKTLQDRALTGAK